MMMRRRMAAAAMGALAMSVVAACGQSEAAAPAATGPATLPQVPLVTVKLGDTNFSLEIADTPEKQEKGLMFRPSMPATAGMLFVFDKPDTVSFWMKNTEIPLDIIFLDASGKVIAIQRREPHDETGMGPPSPALFVIEVNAGRAAAVGLKVGDTVALPEKYLKPGAQRNDK
ncbi:MAG TPA: DUF192 domain-containing protein [Phycisphaerae bacterium]|nr:DUF192 domain-containing protein [Phycisphaerae bacterium]